MAYQPSVQGTVRLGTTNTTSANLGATLFLVTAMNTKFRTVEYGSFQEIRDDVTISPNTDLYKGALTYFSQVGAAVPFYVGRRTADDVTISVSTVSNNSDYEFSLEVYDETTLDGVVTNFSVTSDADATDLEIAAALFAEVDGTANLTAVDNLNGTLTITPAAGYNFVLSNLTDNLTPTFTSTETASTAFAGVLTEKEEDFYFTCTSDHTPAFILALAAEVEATKSSDFPKQFHVSVQESDVLTPYVQGTSTDTLSQLLELGYDLTASYWHQSADTIFPELSMTAIMGALFPSSSSWKFQQPTGVPAVADPVTGKNLTTGKQGYIKDRNASWMGIERGVNFNHGGKMVGGEWIDVWRGAHWINDQHESRVLNLLLNRSAVGDKVSFLASDVQSVLDVYNSVLSEAVTRKILTGYIPAFLKVDPSFANQAERTLDDIEFTGFLSGSVYFVLSNGSLTYKDASLA